MKKYNLLIIILILGAWAGPAAAYEAGGVNIHGFVSQGFIYSDEYSYLATDTEDGSFEYNEMGINFSKELTDKLRIGVQLFSRDLGDVANNKVTVDWAYADYRHWDWLGLRAGRIKLPMGLYNETRDMDMLRTSIVLPQGIYNDLLRDNLIAINGVSLYGNVDLGVVGGLEYQALVGAVNIDEDSGPGKYANDGLSVYNGEITGPFSTDTHYAGAIRWETPLPDLKLGYSILRQEVEFPIVVARPLNIPATLEGPTTTQVVSAEYVWDKLTLAAEYWHRKNVSQVLGIESTVKQESYYLMASYRFVDWFTLGAYYSIYYQNKDDRDGDTTMVNGLPVDHKAWEKDLALTLRFDLNDYWVFKIEGHAVDGTANVLAIDNADNDFSEQHWYYGAAKLSVSF